jgi:multidrug efflux system outer membrane protein
MIKSFSLILVGALALTGCAMMPDYERPESPVPAAFPSSTATNESRSAEVSWTNFFSDERLQQLIGLALSNNSDFRVAVLNVEQSRAQYRVSRSSLYPSANASGGYQRSGNFHTASEQWSASLGSTAYELDLFGRVRSLNRQALEKYFATVEGRRGARVTLVSEVATEYLTLRQTEEQIELAKETLKTVQDSYDLNKATFDAGASSELDMRTAEGQVQSAKISLLSYQRSKAEAENYLALLLGQPLPTNLPPSRPFDSHLLAEVPAGLPSELITRRPDILQSEHTLKAANANIGAMRAAFFPTISLTASVGTSSVEFQKLFGSGTGVWSFSPQVTVPLFTAGQNKANLDSAKISVQIEVENYKKAIETAFREVSDSLVDGSSYSKQIEEEQVLIATQQRRYELANERYRQGEDTYLNVLSAQQNLYSARQELLQARFQHLSSRISLYKALGGGWN